MAAVLAWVTKYDRSALKGDIFAGITTGVMLIPQGMAYALIAGLPPIYGLYAALIPPVIYAFLGTSYQLSVGPVATVSLLVFAGLNEQGLSDGQFIVSASLLALFMGLIQLLFGVLRLGFIVNFLSRPVIAGYTSAAAFIIGFSQLTNLLGIEGKAENVPYKVILFSLQNLDKTEWGSLAFGAAAILILLLVRKLNARLPSSIVVVLLSIAVVYAFDLGSTIDIVGVIPSGFPSLTVPSVSLEQIQSLLPLSLIVALVGFLESISISKTLQIKNNHYSVNPNAELIALGTANVCGAFFKGFPVSGGFARSVVNEQAGAKTPLAIVVGSLLIAIALLFLTPVFYYLPKSILAAIIMVAVVQLVRINDAVFLWKINKRDFWMMLATFAATLAFGIQEGIVTGVVLSLGLVIYKSTYPHTAVLGKLPDSNYYRNIHRFPYAKERKDVLIFRFDSQLYFANIQYFSDTLWNHVRAKNNDLKAIVVNAQAISELDASAIYGLKEIVSELKKREIKIYFTEVIGPVRDAMSRSGLFDLIGAEYFHMRVQDALDHFDNEKKGEAKYAWQSNE